MSETIVALTGHRPDKLGGYGRVNVIRDKLKEALSVHLREHGVSRWAGLVYSGMAQGFDQWGTEVCVSQDIPFVAVIPFQGQETRWPEPAQRWYRHLLSKAQRVQVVSEIASVAAFQARNIWMVEHATRVVACFNGTVGGTKNCVDYAVQRKKPLFNIYDPSWFK